MVTEYLDGPSKVVWLYGLCHGKDTPGKKGPTFKDIKGFDFNIEEWMYGRDIIKRLININIFTNTNFIIINPEDNDVSIQEKAFRANKITLELKFKGYYPIGIDLHGNAANIESANGIEIFTSVGETKADKIATMFGYFYNNLDMNMREDFCDIGWKDMDKEKNFYILKRTIAPFILPEIGFYTNYNDALKMNDSNFRELVAKLTWSAQRKVEDKVKYGLI